MKANRRSRRLARQLFQLCLVGGKLDSGRVRQVAKRLADGSERNSLAVLSAFQRMVRLDHAKHTAVIESAEPLTDEVRRVVEAQLTRLHGADLGISVGNQSGADRRHAHHRRAAASTTAACAAGSMRSSGNCETYDGASMIAAQSRRSSKSEVGGS